MTMMRDSSVLVLIGVLIYSHVPTITGLDPFLPVVHQSENNNNNNNNNLVKRQDYLSCDECFNCLCKDNCNTHTRKRFIFGKDEVNSFFHNVFCPRYGIDCDEHKHDGHWTHWGQWGECTGTVTDGSRTRTKQCSNPAPTNCGNPCHGDAVETQKGCHPLHPITHAAATTITPTTAAPTPTTTTTTTTTPTTTTTKMPSTAVHVTPTATPSPISNAPSTTAAAAFTSCNKLCTVTAVANKKPVLQANTLQCSNNTTGTSEALALHCCGNLDHPLTRPGGNVMVQCDTFPRYSAVALFRNGRVVPGTEGVFIGCLSAPEVGFQIIRQDCITLPSLVHVNTTQTLYGSPYAFFALV